MLLVDGIKSNENTAILMRCIIRVLDETNLQITKSEIHRVLNEKIHEEILQSTGNMEGIALANANQSIIRNVISIFRTSTTTVPQMEDVEASVFLSRRRETKVQDRAIEIEQGFEEDAAGPTPRDLLK